MAFLQKNCGPNWKLDFFSYVGISIPADFATAIEKEQKDWESQRALRTTPEYHQKKAKQRKILAAKRADEAQIANLKVRLFHQPNHFYKRTDEEI